MGEPRLFSSQSRDFGELPSAHRADSHVTAHFLDRLRGLIYRDVRRGNLGGYFCRNLSKCGV